MLRDLELDVLATIDRLETSTVGGVDGGALLDALGEGYEDDGKLFRTLSKLCSDGLLTGTMGGGMSVRNSGLLETTESGRWAIEEAIGPRLEPEQEALLTSLIEAAQKVPRKEQSWHLISYGGGHIIHGAGIKEDVAQQDMIALEHADLIQNTGRAQGNEYVLTPTARKRYAVVHRTHGDRTGQQEQQVRRLLDDEAFRRNYPQAYAHWSDAADLLWSAESDRSLTAIGHACREAMQAFATEALALYKPPSADQDTAKVKRRLGAVIQMLRPLLGERRARLLEALGDYEEALIDLIQRQVHRGQQEGERLTWGDARRVVFHTMSVMVELASSFEEAARHS
jgi:hypothetical protein